ncbi:MAG: hypothetical protein GY795_45620 [Desulfobacterales bacterium]|nr:hypothetical protein [Desulfobacterales bacterium]
MKFWQNPDSVPKFHFGTPSDCQLKNEGCQSIPDFFVTGYSPNSRVCPGI